MSRDKNAPTARSLAVDILLDWQLHGKTISSLTEKHLQKSSLSDRDKQLCFHILLGVLRKLKSLDWTIGRFSKHPIKKMKPLTLVALRIGVYQLLFMDKIPTSAAVNETVHVLKKRRQPKWLVGFANAVLRSTAKDRDNIKTMLAQNHSCSNHPKWLVTRWDGRFGKEKTRAICRINDEEPILCLCCNSRQISRDQLLELLHSKNIDAVPGRYAPHSIIVNNWSGSIVKLPGYDKGYFHVQDQAAQLATLLIGPFQSGKNYLDACAGLGGKTAYLAQLLPDDAALTAVEPENRRFARLGDNLTRLGCQDRCTLQQNTLEFFCRNTGQKFDAILLDAPCSGTGVIRRHPDIRWNRTAEDLQDYKKKQKSLLGVAAQMLKPGGILVYVTCSLEAEENEEVIASFLAEHALFHLAAGNDFLPETAAALIDNDGFLQPTPDMGLDGFFGARLVYDGCL